MATSLRTGLVALVLAVAPIAVGCGSADDQAYAVEAEQDATQKAGRFEIFVGHDGQYYFHLLAANGENVLRSEGYTTMQAAQNGIASVQANGVSAEGYEVNEASNGEWYFNIVAPNGQIVGTSELYATHSGCNTAVGKVMGIIAKTVVTQPAPTGGARFEIFKGLDNKYYFHLRAANGEIMLQSQGYTKRTNAVNGVASVRSNGQSEGQYEVQLAANDQYFFTIEAGNHQVIAHGETYASLYNAERAVDRLVELLASGQVADPQ
jgi:uncharacterized protein